MATALLGTTVIPPFLGLSNADTREITACLPHKPLFTEIESTPMGPHPKGAYILFTIVGVWMQFWGTGENYHANGATTKRCIYTVHICRRLDAILGHWGKLSRRATKLRNYKLPIFDSLICSATNIGLSTVNRQILCSPYSIKLLAVCAEWQPLKSHNKSSN